MLKPDSSNIVLTLWYEPLRGEIGLAASTPWLKFGEITYVGSAPIGWAATWSKSIECPAGYGLQPACAPRSQRNASNFTAWWMYGHSDEWMVEGRTFTEMYEVHNIIPLVTYKCWVYWDISIEFPQNNVLIEQYEIIKSCIISLQTKENYLFTCWTRKFRQAVLVMTTCFWLFVFSHQLISQRAAQTSLKKRLDPFSMGVRTRISKETYNHFYHMTSRPGVK